MHRVLEDGLERHLDRGNAPKSFYEHLAVCTDCRQTLDEVTAQRALLASLRVNEELDPRAGFYARVRERIEAGEIAPFWGLLVDPLAYRRLALASLTLLVLLTGYWIGAPAPTLALTADSDSVVIVDSNGEDRNSVLATLTSFSETSAVAH